jgi:hypothetical protein
VAERPRDPERLTVVAVGIGFAISMVLALVAVRWRWTYEPLAGVCCVLYAIPSLALFGVLVSIPFFGLGFRTATVALVSYTLLILLRNIVTGLDWCRPATGGGRRMGFERWRRLQVDIRRGPGHHRRAAHRHRHHRGPGDGGGPGGGGRPGRLITEGLGRLPTPIVIRAVVLHRLRWSCWSTWPSGPWVGGHALATLAATVRTGEASGVWQAQGWHR